VAELEQTARGLADADAMLADDRVPPLLYARLLEGTRVQASAELDDWLAGEQNRVDLLQDSANGHLVRELLDHNRTETAYALARRWHERDPANEEAVAAFMRCAFLSSREPEVRTAFEAYTRALEEDEPSSDVMTLYESLAGEGAPSGPKVAHTDQGATAPSTARRTTLPLPADRFVGREREIEELRRFLITSALITIWAPGGAGKTRLSLEFARALLPDFADGVFFAPLGDIDAPGLVLETLAAALGVSREPDVLLEDTIAGFIGGRRLVLVLDNCEHVREECARIVEIIVRTIGDSRIIATSREPLEVAGEKVFRLHPLETPLDNGKDLDIDDLFDSPAVELFVDRAMRFDPDFSLDPSTAGPVAAICRRLDGFPLALEIAAASLRTLGIEEVARSLDDRFAQLVRSTPGHSRAHSTINEVIDWSFRLLSDGAAQLFERLGVFPASFRLETVEFVCAELQDDDIVRRRSVLSWLDELVRKSLVVVKRDSGISSFSLYQLVRVFAVQRLEATRLTEPLRDRLLSWVRQQGELLVQRVYHPDAAEPTGDEQRASVAWFRGELPSILRSAMDYAIASSRISDGLRIGVDFEMYWWSENLTTELVSYLKRLLPLSDGVEPWLRVSAYAIAAAHIWGTGEESPIPYIDAGLAIAETAVPAPDPAVDLHTRTSLALLLWIAATDGRETTDWRSLIERSVEIGKTLLPQGMLQTLVRAANVFELHGDHERAQSLVDEAERLGVTDHEFFTLRGIWYSTQGRHDEAERVFKDGLRDAAGESYWHAGALVRLVLTAVQTLEAQGRFIALLGFASWGLCASWESGERGNTYANASRIMRAYFGLGAFAAAERTRAFCEKFRSGLPATLRLRTEEYDKAFPIPPIRDSAAPHALEPAWADGQTLGALEIVELGRADAFEYAAGDPESLVWLELLDNATNAAPQ
jgi:predicted ATPase